MVQNVCSNRRVIQLSPDETRVQWKIYLSPSQIQTDLIAEARTKGSVSI